MMFFEIDINNLIEMKNKIGRYLRKEWSVEYYPNLTKIIYDLKIKGSRALSLFYAVLAYFEEYNIIVIGEENEIKRIFPHPGLNLNELLSELPVNTSE